MSEEERRELIARQRNALYGEGSFPENGGFDDNGTPRPGTQGSGTQSATGVRGHSPLAFDHFNAQASQGENVQQSSEQSTSAPQQRSRANSTSSPSSNPPNNFSLFESAAQQSSRTSTSSPGGSPPRQGKTQASSGVAPIGTRPSGAQAQNPSLNKRSTTPLPSPLSYGFAANEDSSEQKDKRATSAASNPNNNSQSQQDVALGWGSKSGVWGSKNSLGVQASVWG
jgi:hypothetical protein